MGLFDFFKKKGIDNGTFNSSQFQHEVLAFALWKFKETNDYSKVKNELSKMQDVDLSESQIEVVINKLKHFTTTEETPAIQVGQTWQYHTRSHERNSQAYIFKIDPANNEEIIHISLSNLEIKKSENISENVTTVGHVPLSKNAFLKSISNLKNQDNNLPKTEEGYYNWKQAYDDGKAGVFDIEIKEIVDFIEKTLK